MLSNGENTSGGMIQLPGFSPVNYNSVSRGSGIKANVNLTKEGDIKTALGINGGLQILDSIGNMLATGLNYGLQGQQIEANKAVAEAYYDSVNTVASYKQQVAMRQLDVQETAMYTQQNMHKAQIDHEQRMMKLENSARVAIARVQEDGKSERARVLSVIDTFSARRSWSYGYPSSIC